MPAKNNTIYTLGPSFSFHELSLLSYLEINSLSFSIELVKDFEQLFALALSGEKVWVAVENSLAGEVFDHKSKAANMALEKEVSFQFQVDFVLAANKGAKREPCIYTHPKAYEECKSYLDKHYPHAEIINTASTAEAAHLVADLPEYSLAICHERAAKAYDLAIINKHLLGKKTNHTIFNLLKKS